MRSTVFILFIISSLFSIPKAQAENDKPAFLPPTKSLVSRRVINDYFDGKHVMFSSSDSHLSRIQLVSLAGVHLSLDMILEKLETSTPTFKTKDRIQRLLLFTARLAEFSAKEDNMKLRMAIHRQLDQLLLIFRIQSLNQETVIRIMDALNLWSGENLWFFKQYVRSPSRLILHHDRIKRLLPKLSEKELAEFTSLLRSQRPYHIAQLSLLMEIGPLSETERSALIKITSADFERLDISRFQFNVFKSGLENISGENRPSQVYLFAVQKMADLIRAGNPDYLSSVHKVRADYEAEPPSLERNVRLMFLKMLMREDIDWMAALKWQTSAGFKSAPRYEKDGNVLIVHFGAHENCAQTLQ